MKNIVLINLIVIVSVFFCSCVAQKTVNGQSTTLDSKETELSLSIKLNKSTFRLDDSGSIFIQMKNNSELPFYLYKYFRGGTSESFTYWILDEHGELIVRDPFTSSKPPPPNFKDNVFAYLKEDFVKLEKEKPVVIKKFLEISEEGIKNPGKYTLVVFYQSHVSKEYVPNNLNVWTTKKGKIKSNAVSFTVLK